MANPHTLEVSSLEGFVGVGGRSYGLEGQGTSLFSFTHEPLALIRPWRPSRAAVSRWFKIHCLNSWVVTLGRKTVLT